MDNVKLDKANELHNAINNLELELRKTNMMMSNPGGLKVYDSKSNTMARSGVEATKIAEINQVYLILLKEAQMKKLEELRTSFAAL